MASALAPFADAVDDIAVNGRVPGSATREVLAIDEPHVTLAVADGGAGMAGVTLGVLLFLTVVPVVVAAMVGLAWPVAGQPG